MERSRVLRLFLVGTGSTARERAHRIVDRLAAERSVSGGESEWTVIYGTSDLAEAKRLCESELTAIDPRWLEILDFEAMPPSRLSAMGSA